MYGKLYSAWFHAGIDAWSLSMEASAVIGMRMAKMAAGGDAARAEGQLMVSEKISAAFELQAKLARAPLSTSPLSGTQAALRHYRRKVARNRRRLGA